MTRKRYIKLAMSYGLSRNEAVQTIEYLQRYKSYNRLFIESYCKLLVVSFARKYLTNNVSVNRFCRILPGHFCEISVDDLTNENSLQD